MGHTFVYMYLLSSSSGSVLLGSSPLSRGVKIIFFTRLWNDEWHRFDLVEGFLSSFKVGGGEGGARLVWGEVVPLS